MLRKSSKITAAGITALMLTSSLTFVNSATQPNAASVKKEGKLISYGMPDEWANYKDIFKTFTTKYGITHQDTDMSSADELAKFKAEKNKPVADIGDIGITFGSIAKSQSIVQPYKNKFWNSVPSWAKDKDGYWTGAYSCTIAFLVNKKLVKDIPHSFKDLLKPEYKNGVAIGDVTKAAQAQNAVLAAAFANGGSEKNIQPGLDYFKKLKKEGNLKDVDVKIGNFQKGEIPVGVIWDFNALGYKKQAASASDYVVVIPKDATVISAYVAVINKYAPHPNAAKAWQDYLFSDEGQIKLAKGLARPIREDAKLPDDVKKEMLPSSDYKAAKSIKDYSVWDNTAKELPQLWRDQIQAQ